MSFELTILGNSSSTPTARRHPSAQVLKINNDYILIDCGEGTQNQLLRYKISHNKLRYIFISHMHGDHFLGLPGLLCTMNVQGRKDDIDIYCPEELEFLINLQFSLSDVQLKFKINYHKLNFEEPKDILITRDYTVKSFPVKHRINCVAFLFSERTYGRKINKQECEKLNLNQDDYEKLRDGEDYIDKKGKRIPNKQLTFDPRRSFRYAYITDTIYDEGNIPFIEKFDLLYHEATFAHDMVDRAKTTFHSTALQAGKLASRAKVGKLLIGHFSARYISLTELLDEAKDVFPRTELAEEGKKFTLR
jgi:ribonuclease Z